MDKDSVFYISGMSKLSYPSKTSEKYKKPQARNRLLRLLVLSIGTANDISGALWRKGPLPITGHGKQWGCRSSPSKGLWWHLVLHSQATKFRDFTNVGVLWTGALPLCPSPSKLFGLRFLNPSLGMVVALCGGCFETGSNSGWSGTHDVHQVCFQLNLNISFLSGSGEKRVSL